MAKLCKGINLETITTKYEGDALLEPYREAAGADSEVNASCDSGYDKSKITVAVKSGMKIISYTIHLGFFQRG